MFVLYAESPRLRLVLPLSRTVSPDEYTAIARKVAEMVDIEQFDDSTYEPSRLMFWPSSASDADFMFEFMDAEWLDPDTILVRYENWQDSLSWPVSSCQKIAVQKSIAQAHRGVQPREKRDPTGNS